MTLRSGADYKTKTGWKPQRQPTEDSKSIAMLLIVLLQEDDNWTLAFRGAVPSSVAYTLDGQEFPAVFQGGVYFERHTMV